MTVLRKHDLDDLLRERDGPCVSLYLPTHRTGREIQQDPIRLKNLLRRAETELEQTGVRGSRVRDLLAPARDLLDDKHFWEHQSDGLAVFLAGGFERSYRVPASFRELAVVAERFHVKPLLSLLSGDGRFYVLALSQNRVRLLQGTRFRVGEMDLAGVPNGLAEALWMDDPEKSLQFHSGGGGARGRGTAIYHGHGADVDLEKTNLQRYFRRVDQGIGDLLEGERAPLVLAGVGYYFPLYREVSTYPALLPEGIAGNPDELSPEELHRRAWTLVEPGFRREQEEARARYRTLAGTGKTSRQVEEIVAAAHHGRVEVLFVALAQHCWGTFDEEGGGRVSVHAAAEPGDQDLLDLAAAAVLRGGGTVYVVEPDQVPARSPAAAILRY